MLPNQQQDFHGALDDIEVEVVRLHLSQACPVDDYVALQNLFVKPVLGESNAVATVAEADDSQLEAKAALEHNLESLRMTRAERERAAGPSPVTEPIDPRSSIVTLDKPSNTRTEIAGSSNLDATTDVDSGMTHGTHVSLDLTQVDALVGSSMSDSTGIKDAAQTGTLDPPSNTDDHSIESIQIPDTLTIDESATADVDFDSMFPADDNVAMDFDLDFTNGTIGAAADLRPPSGQETTSLSTNAATTVDLDSLIPDLDSYVGSTHGEGGAVESEGFGGDISMLELPTTDPEKPLLGKVGSTETTFDDLFGDTDLPMDGEVAGEMEELGEFDDEWFKAL